MLHAALRRPSNLLLHSVQTLDDHYGGGSPSDKERSRTRKLFFRAHEQLMRGAINARAIAGRAHAAGVRGVQRMQKAQPPLCFRIMYKMYHKYGMKHVVLIGFFVLYTALGGLAFWLLERGHQGGMKDEWKERIAANRTDHVENLMLELFNNTHYMLYANEYRSERAKQLLLRTFAEYESKLGVKWSDQKMEWDYLNSVLFAGTLCTTIGYGHMYPMTDAGKILTMVYAIFGIPLMLLVLQDFGKLLTIFMKFPWFQTKRLARRILRCCTKQSLKEMKEIEDQERRDLDIFDLPLIVGVSLVVLWVWVCTFVLSYWDTHWSLLEAFYFFFISLSTIGLGDLVPHPPRLLLIMFFFILVGLSLVSMVVNLLQMKMRKTYEAGKKDKHLKNDEKNDGVATTSLGVLHCFDDSPEGEDEEKKAMLASDESDRVSRSTQTSLSLPGARQVVLRSDGVHWVERNSPRSPDEVTRLVELESGLAVCTDIGEFNRDETDNEDDNENYEKQDDRLLAENESLSDRIID
ncbi:twk-35 [Pristionchus pacificus]|uniref:Twk-35 n=1 Tax=Pristionchus pacificus TaxID=54126 RepID=A0A2A6C8I0_PRIPA|nr:twk-35 [Pristionchus pacificus]|eukprot:PDM74515.1 twk-35 [Pristionchus pacificus]